MRKILIACLAIAPTMADAESPSDAVRFFYANTTFETDPAIRDRYAVPAKAILDQHDLVWETREEVCIDFSIAFDAQDFDEAEVARTLELDEEIEGDNADVLATFTLFDAPRKIVWSLKREDGWKISDVASPESGWRLSEFVCK